MLLDQRMVNAVDRNFEFVVKPNVYSEYGSGTASTTYDIHIKTNNGQDICELESLNGAYFVENMQSIYQLIYAAMKCPEPQEIRRIGSTKIMTNPHLRGNYLARKLSYQCIPIELIEQMCNSGINPRVLDQFINHQLYPVDINSDIKDILPIVSESEDISQEKVLELKKKDPRRVLAIYKTHLCKKFLEENMRHLDRNTEEE